MNRRFSSPAWRRATSSARARIVAATAVVVAVAAPLREAGAAGQVARYDRSHTYGDFDGDGLLDHVLGYPRANDDRGTVVVVYGSGRVVEFNRDSYGILGTADIDDFFGDSLSAGDLDNDGYDDLVVGVPGDDIWFGAVRD